MIKMYVMQTCPDCEYVEKHLEGNPNFEVIDIGKHVRNLKEFVKLRDSHPAFDEAKAVGDSVLCAGRWYGDALLEGCWTGTETSKAGATPQAGGKQTFTWDFTDQQDEKVKQGKL